MRHRHGYRLRHRRPRAAVRRRRRRHGSTARTEGLAADPRRRSEGEAEVPIAGFDPGRAEVDGCCEGADGFAAGAFEAPGGRDGAFIPPAGVRKCADVGGTDGRSPGGLGTRGGFGSTLPGAPGLLLPDRRSSGLFGRPESTTGTLANSGSYGPRSDASMCVDSCVGGAAIGHPAVAGPPERLDHPRIAATPVGLTILVASGGHLGHAALTDADHELAVVGASCLDDVQIGEKGVRATHGRSVAERVFDGAEPCGALPEAQGHAARNPGLRVVTRAAVRVQIAERRLRAGSPGIWIGALGGLVSVPSAIRSSMRIPGLSVECESWIADTPSSTSFMLPWQKWQASCDGISCGVPRAFTCPSGTATASLRSSFHRRRSCPVVAVGPSLRSMRVSTRMPSRENSFHAVVPTGYVQKSMSEVSICSPFGK